jgi:hypothetical protein
MVYIVDTIHVFAFYFKGAIVVLIAEVYSIQHYEGKISKTASGIVCQEWAKSEPHRHGYTKKLAEDSNHCRNPDGSAKPWCYTMNEKKRWCGLLFIICPFSEDDFIVGPG